MPDTEIAYLTREVCDQTGVSYRALDYWVRRGVVTPSICEATGSGSRRRWSTHDLAIVKVVAAVAVWGRIPLMKLAGMTAFLTDLPLQQWAATSIVLDMDGGVWIEGAGAPKVGILVDLSLIYDPAE